MVGVLLRDLGVPFALLPAISATQCRRVQPSGDRSTPSMNFGNSSNWVHWLYAVETGTSISIDSSICS